MNSTGRTYFNIGQDRDGKWRARLFDINGNLVWWTEGYSRREHAETAVRIAKSTGSDTPTR